MICTFKALHRNSDCSLWYLAVQGNLCRSEAKQIDKWENMTPGRQQEHVFQVE